MKRLFLSAMLAVAFIVAGFGFCEKAEAKERLESRFMTIVGKPHVVTESVSDSGLREVVNVVDISDVKVAARASKQRPAIAAKKEISPIAKAKKNEEPKKNLNTAIKKDVSANNTADINVVKKTEVPKTISEKMNVKKENTANITALKNTPKVSLGKTIPGLEKVNAPNSRGSEHSKLIRPILVEYFPWDEQYVSLGNVVREISQRFIEIQDENGIFRQVEKPRYIVARHYGKNIKPKVTLEWVADRPPSKLYIESEGLTEAKLGHRPG